MNRMNKRERFDASYFGHNRLRYWVGIRYCMYPKYEHVHVNLCILYTRVNLDFSSLDFEPNEFQKTAHLLAGFLLGGNRLGCWGGMKEMKWNGEMKWKTGEKFLSSKCKECADDDFYPCFFHAICNMSVSRILLQTWLDLPLELSWNSLPSLNRINSRKMLDVYRGHEMENWREKFLSSKSNMCADDDAYRFFSIPYATCRFGNLLQMWLDG